MEDQIIGHVQIKHIDKICKSKASQSSKDFYKQYFNLEFKTKEHILFISETIIPIFLSTHISIDQFSIEIKNTNIDLIAYSYIVIESIIFTPMENCPHIYTDIFQQMITHHSNMKNKKYNHQMVINDELEQFFDNSCAETENKNNESSKNFLI